MVIGLHLGGYSLVAADSRLVSYRPGHGVRVDDRAEKVCRTPAGLASGTENWNIVRSAVQAMAARPDVLVHSRATADFLAGHYARFLRAAVSPPSSPAMRSVGWVMTSVERRRLLVTSYLSSRAFEPLEASEEAPIVLLPPDIRPQQARVFEAELVEALRPARSAADAYVTIDRNVGALIRFFTSLQSISYVLGPGLQIGYHSGLGDVELTRVILPAELDGAAHPFRYE